MSALEISVVVPFTEPLIFRGFVPTQQSPLRFTLEGMNVSAYCDTKNWAGDPESPMSCDRLIVVATVDVDDAVADSIRGGSPSDATEAFGRDLLNRIDRFTHLLVDYARNVNGQHWLQPLRLAKHTPDETLRNLEAKIHFPEARAANPLRTERTSYLTFNITTRAGGIYGRNVADLTAFVEGGKRSSAWQEFNSNAWSALTARNFRSAVVESVTALEAAIKTLYPKIILNNLGPGDVEAKDVDKLVENAGLRATAAVLLKLTLRKEGWSDDQLNALLEAITLRNELVHAGRRVPNEQDARAVVELVHKALQVLARAA